MKTELRSDEANHARYAAELKTAETLRKSADEARGDGREADARQFEDRAQELQELARALGIAFDERYAKEDGTFDESRYVEEGLTRYRVRAVNPAQSGREADGLHDKSERTVVWIVVLSGSLWLLTAAQFVQATRRRLLVAAAVSMYLAAAIGGGVA